MKSVNWAYQQEPGPWTGGRSIYAPRGKTLGGSSSINGHIYNRGQRQDFDTWAQLGNRGWGYPDVLPYFKRLERRVGEGDETYRGRDGSLTVTTMDWTGSALRGLHGGRRQPRHSAQPRLQRRDPGGRVLLPAHHRERPAHERREGVPASGAQARRMSMCARMRMSPTSSSRASARSACAISRAARAALRSRCAPARRSFFPAAPTTPPQVLQLSGVGSPELLQSHGIEVAPRAAGRRRRPAGSLRAAFGGARQEHQDHQRTRGAA